MANRRLLLVRSVDELPICGHGRLPNGVTCYKWGWGDSYTAAKETLIAAGIARAEWFPTVPVPIPNRPGKFQRSFIAETEHGEVRLSEDGATGKWTVGLPASDEEQKRRDAAWSALMERRHAELESREEDERLAALKAALRSLPPFHPGSMSESEKHHMRILRGLDEDRRDIVMEFAERTLCRVLVGPAPEVQAPRQRLSLVVDNGAQPSG